MQGGLDETGVNLNHRCKQKLQAFCYQKFCSKVFNYQMNNQIQPALNLEQIVIKVLKKSTKNFLKKTILSSKSKSKFTWELKI